MASSRNERFFHNPSESEIEFRTVVQMGNSVGVTIPTDEARQLDISPGDQVAVRVTDEGRVDVVCGGVVESDD